MASVRKRDRLKGEAKEGFLEGERLRDQQREKNYKYAKIDSLSDEAASVQRDRERRKKALSRARKRAAGNGTTTPVSSFRRSRLQHNKRTRKTIQDLQDELQFKDKKIQKMGREVRYLRNLAGVEELPASASGPTVDPGPSPTVDPGPSTSGMYPLVVDTGTDSPLSEPMSSSFLSMSSSQYSLPADDEDSDVEEEVVSAPVDPAEDESPRTQVKSLMRKDGLSPSKHPAVRKELLVSKVVASDVRSVISSASTVAEKQVVARTFAGPAAVQYRQLSNIGRFTGIHRKTISSQSHSMSDSSSPGILAVSRKSRDDAFSPDQLSLVQAFYERDDNSRMMPGKKDTITKKAQIYQKRLLLDYMKVLHEKFLLENPGFDISYTKFTMLRPVFVVVPKLNERDVCLCIYHESPGLKVQALNAAGALTSTNVYFVACNCTCGEDAEDKEACWMRQCEDCKEIELTDILDGEDLDLNAQVRWSVWVDNPEGRLVKQTVHDTVETLANELFPDLQKLIPHIYICSNQFSQFRKLKNDLPPRKMIIQCDFAENYTCLQNREIQSAYWGQASVTIHPFMCWYRPEADGAELVEYPVIVVSDCLEHNINTAHAFQTELFHYFDAMADLPIDHVFYLSDGAASQYKNKSNFSNLTFHVHDFGMTAEWNFFVTAHGKGACDGLGATVKRCASDIVKHGSGNIVSARTFCDQVSPRVNPKLLYAPSERVSPCSLLEDRFDGIQPVKGTQNMHQVIPVGRYSVKVSPLSCYCDSCIAGVPCEIQSGRFSVHFLKPAPAAVRPPASASADPVPSVGDFVAAVYDDKWFVAQVEQSKSIPAECFLKFMKWGKGNQVSWPDTNVEECWVVNSDILSIISQPTPHSSLRYHVLLDEDFKSAKALFARYRSRK